MSIPSDDAILGAYPAIAGEVDAIIAGKPTAAVLLAFGALLGNMEMKALIQPSRAELLRLLIAGMDNFLKANQRPLAERLRPEIREAASVSCGACDFCPAVHVNLIDHAGDKFATASVPAHVGEEFIRRFRAALVELGRRSAAPVPRQ